MYLLYNILHNSNKKQFCCIYSTLICFSNWLYHVDVFSHSASTTTISLMPALSPLPHWPIQQSLSRLCGKPCSDSHVSLVAAQCTSLFAVPVWHFMIRSLKFEAQYLLICRYNYAVATLVTEVLSKAQSAGVSMSLKSFHYHHFSHLLIKWSLFLKSLVSAKQCFSWTHVSPTVFSLHHGHMLIVQLQSFVTQTVVLTVLLINASLSITCK